MGESCLDILGGQYDQGDGLYTIDPDGTAGAAPYNVYCDLTTDGGGWTVLLNSVGYGLATTHPDLSH